MSSTTYIIDNISHWHGYKHEGVIEVGESWSAQRKPMCQAGNHHTVSHTTTVNHGDQTWVTSVRNKCIVHCATLNNPVKFLSLISIYYIKLQLQCINFDKLINCMQVFK